MNRMSISQAGSSMFRLYITLTKWLAKIIQYSVFLNLNSTPETATVKLENQQNTKYIQLIVHHSIITEWIKREKSKY